jgi:hypothetical protein
MDYADSWKPDPFGMHELRFFSADGKPTALVMDGGKRSFDRPAAQEHPVVPPPSAAAPSVETPPVETPPETAPVVESPPIAPPPVASPRLQSDTPADPAVTNTLTVSMSPASVVEPISMARVGDPAAASTSAASSMVMVDHGSQNLGPETDAPSLLGEAEEAPPQAIGDPRNGAMSRHLKIAYAGVLGLLAISVVGVVLIHVAHQSNAPVAPVAAATTTTTTNATTTTAAPPTSLSPSAAAAAAALISSWSKNDQAAALTVATPAAVSTLFGSPYTSGQAIDRGCSTSFTPIVCTYGPPGGASPTDPIYQVMVSQTDGGWYVSSVKKEN